MFRVVASTSRYRAAIAALKAERPMIAGQQERAEAARAEAAEAAHALARGPEPVSVFISRKTQRLYVRQAFEPMFDIPVTIRDPDLPIGTHIFTAVERGGGKGDVQWNVVSLVGSKVGMTETTHK